jgi:hypothetical protein
MSDVAQLFGAHADAYASSRPAFPDAPLDWLSTHSPGDDGERRTVNWPLHFLAGTPT